MDCISFYLSNGQKSFALYNNGVPVEVFNVYINELARIAAKNTTVNTASDLKTFFVYLDALSDPTKVLRLVGYLDKTPLLTQVIQSFPFYLARGIENTKESLAYLAAAKTNRQPTSDSTNQRIIASVRRFLRESAALHLELQAASDMGLIDINLAPEAMFKEALFRQPISQSEKQHLFRKSLLAGVISNGPRYANSSLLKYRSGLSFAPPVGSGINKGLPPRDTLPLLNEAKTLRDRCLWALMLGTGLRSIEAFALLLRDINVEERTILCINPTKRPLEYGNTFERISGETLSSTAYKGRETEVTMFIEPFRTIFFETLSHYLREERAPLHCGHQFLFIALKKPYEGRPLVLSSHKTRQYPFTSALRRVYQMRGQSMPQNNFGLHSTRHFYGTYCLNYMPSKLQDGNIRYGLMLNTVQQMMGHSSPDSTRIYAIPDLELVRRQAEDALKEITSIILSDQDQQILTKHFGADFEVH